MPRKGSYHLANTSPEEGLPMRQHKDYSYPACLATMLAFLALCVIIIVCTAPWKHAKDGHTNGAEDGHNSRMHGANVGNIGPRIGDSGPPKTTSTENPEPVETQRNVVSEDDEDNNNTLSPESRSSPSTTTTSTIAPTTEEDYNEAAFEGRNSNEDKPKNTPSTTVSTTEKGEPKSDLSDPEKTSTTQSVREASESVSTTQADEKNDQPTENSSTPSTPSSTTTKMQLDENGTKAESRCPSQLCSTIASRQLSLMNVDANPCDDFYEFACGSLRKNRNLAEANPEAHVHEKLRMAIKKFNTTDKSVQIRHRFFKSFYEDCISYENNFNYEDRLKKAKAVLQSVGTFRVTDHADSMVLTDLVAKMLLYNSTPLFDIMLDVSDDGREAPFSIKIVPPLPRNSFFYPSSHVNAGRCFAETIPPEEGNVHTDELYANYTVCKNNEETYIDSVGKALSEFGAFSDQHGHVETLITNTKVVVEDLLRSNLLTAAQSTEANIRTEAITKIFDIYTLNEFQNQYSMLNWTDLLIKVVGANSTLINDKMRIQVYSKNYFEELFRQLDISSAEPTLYNAILAMFWHMLYSDFVVAKGNCDRPNFCMYATQRFMDDAASSLYLSEFDSDSMASTHAQVREIFRKETSLLTARIKNLPIKDETEKEKMIEKLDNMKIEVGGFRPKRPTPEIYIVEEDLVEDYFAKAMRLLKRRRQRMYSDFRLGRKPIGTAQIWSHFSLSTVTNANAVYGLNAILIPQGLIASKYIPGAPEYINMAILGSIIAHEIIHHLDSTGVNYNADGKRSTAVTTQNENIFQDLSTQLEQQFSFQKSYPIGNGRFADFNINAELSRNERFADVGALDVAYEVVREGLEHDNEDEGYMNLPYVNYNQSKSFFITHAQMFCTKKEFLDFRVKLYEGEHLPPQIRVDMIMRNSGNFLKTFACSTRKTQNFQETLQTTN